MPPSKPHVQLLSPADLPCETSSGGYLRALVECGPQKMAENAIAESFAVAVNDTVLPLLVVEPCAVHCDQSSVIAHHVHYSRDEVLLRTPRELRWLVRLAYAPYQAFLHWGKVNRVIYLNNWLFSTNPCPELSSDELAAVTAFIQREYPEHALVFRSIQPKLFPEQEKAFIDGGYKLLKSRDVFAWAVDDHSCLERKNFRRDSRLLETSSCEIREVSRLDFKQAARLRHLYSGLYLVKHNELNANLTEAFFEQTCNTGALTYRLLINDGVIAGFYCYTVVRDVLIAIVLGYDLAAPRKAGLYRQIVISIIREARQQGLSLSLSAGAGEFKFSRGGKKVVEYEAARFRHLPLRQRLAWRVLQVKCSLSEYWSRRRPL
jgi:hypothetical protein